MIYPLTVGKGEEHLKLRTLESMWIRGRLKMWGRWAAFSKAPSATSMFNQLLEEPTITKKALRDAINRMHTSGLSKETLLMFLEEFKDKKTLSSMWFCSDTEGGEMDKVICEVMNADAGLLNILKQHYVYKKSKHEIALELCEKDGRYCLRTYQDRVKAWLNVAEFMLYRPMCDRFDREYHYSE
ncbi:DUF1133 family protein [Proteus vulgaris]|uniref:DUF1133 family protein n=1 Tax=Proteus TaxID=583 RepID=UPI00163C635E|nr:MULTISPECIES: DUF1133 family protein [Proteus]QNH66939.1 DUF1133 family protein [Proteus vulgaris]UWT99031.1 DUF1133 family protein [Proteus vulgaris]